MSVEMDFERGSVEVDMVSWVGRVHPVIRVRRTLDLNFAGQQESRDRMKSSGPGQQAMLSVGSGL